PARRPGQRAALRPTRDRSRRPSRAGRRCRTRPHGSPVHAARRARREGGARVVEEHPDGSRQGRAAGSLRPLDRRSYLPHPRRDRGRTEAATSHSHRARSWLRLRQAAGLMRRLYLRIYLAVLVSLAVFAVCSGLVWRQFGDAGSAGHAFEVAGTLAQNVLPAAGAPKAEQQAALEQLAANLPADVALFAADRTLLAAVGEQLPAPGAGRDRAGWLRHWGNAPAGTIHLPDGRWLVARAR